MARYDLATMARRATNTRRRLIIFRDIVPPATRASDLYAAVYRPVIDLWSGSAERIVGAYTRTVAEMTTDTPADIQGELDQTEGAFNWLMLELTPALRSWAIRLERWHRGKWAASVLAGARVDISTLIGPEDVRATVGTYIEWNVALVKDVSAQIRQRISNEVFSGLQEQRSVRDVAKGIREAVGMGRDRALRIASDQSSKITAELADERRRQAGLSEWTWQHSRKRHFRPEHEARDGFLYSDDPANVGKHLEGKLVRSPPEASDLPGRPPYCGCRKLSVLVFEFDEDMREAA